MTTTVRAADQINLFQPDHAVVGFLVKLAHYISNMIWCQYYTASILTSALKEFDFPDFFIPQMIFSFLLPWSKFNKSVYFKQNVDII